MEDHQKVLAQKKRWYERHKEEIKRKNLAHYHTLPPEKKAVRKAQMSANLKRWRKKNHAHFLEDAREREKRFRQEFPEKCRQKDRERYHQRRKINPAWRARRNEAVRRWANENKQRRAAVTRQWQINNPELVRANANRYRSRKVSAKGTHTITQWMARVEYFGWRCAYCAVDLTPKSLTKDHVISLLLGGTNWASNLVPACLKCNSSKGIKRKPTS